MVHRKTGNKDNYLFGILAISFTLSPQGASWSIARTITMKLRNAPNPLLRGGMYSGSWVLTEGQ